MISWMKSLFERKPVRKKKVILSKFDVIRLEENFENYNKDTMMIYFNISESVYYKIKRGTHKYSTRSFKWQLENMCLRLLEQCFY